MYNILYIINILCTEYPQVLITCAQYTYGNNNVSLISVHSIYTPYPQEVNTEATDHCIPTGYSQFLHTFSAYPVDNVNNLLTPSEYTFAKSELQCTEREGRGRGVCASPNPTSDFSTLCI